MWFLILISGFLALCESRQPNAVHRAVLQIQAPNNTIIRHFCAYYIPAFKTIPENEAEAEAKPLMTLFNFTLCGSQSPHRVDMTGKTVILHPWQTSCSDNDEVISELKSRRADTAILAHAGKSNSTNTFQQKIDIRVGFIQYGFMKNISRIQTTTNESLTAKLFTITTTWDSSFIVIWICAIFTVTTGSFWSGIVQYAEYKPKPKQPKQQHCKKLPKQREEIPLSAINLHEPCSRISKNSIIEEPDVQFNLEVSPKLIIVFVMHMSCMLFVLYYFYSYLMYFILLMFAIASSGALSACCEPLVKRIPFGTTKTKNNALFGALEYRHIALYVCGFCVGISWLVFRNCEYGWVVQDILSISFAVNMLKLLHLPNMKSLCLLLILLLFYDVFFVFLTPYFSAKRDSIMVEVAQGGQSQEQLPMVIKIPRLSTVAYSDCFTRGKFALLGLGDILAPGLLIGYCHAFDLLALGRRFYYYIALTSYGVGLCFTFFALHIMRNAQPALLYLVPCVLCGVITTAWFKGHLFAIWNGVKLVADPKPVRSRSRSPRRSPRAFTTALTMGPPETTTTAPAALTTKTITAPSTSGMSSTNTKPQVTIPTYTADTIQRFDAGESFIGRVELDTVTSMTTADLCDKLLLAPPCPTEGELKFVDLWTSPRFFQRTTDQVTDLDSCDDFPEQHSPDTSRLKDVEDSSASCNSGPSKPRTSDPFFRPS